MDGPAGQPAYNPPDSDGLGVHHVPYLSGKFGFIDDLDRQFGNGLVWTRTRTRSDGPELFLTLVDAQYPNAAVTVSRSLFPIEVANLLMMNNSEQITFQLTYIHNKKLLTLH